MRPPRVFVGDVHGYLEQLLQVVHGCPKGASVYQLGDVGFGFFHKRPINVGLNSLPDLGKDFHFLRGNHDDPALARKHPNYLGDFGFDAAKSLFWISGAPSIDRGRRQVGVTWWPDEELSNEALEAAHRLYLETRPDIVISHAAPSGITVMLCREMIEGRPFAKVSADAEYYRMKEADCNSRTSQAMHRMLMAYQPRYWIFGHFHADWQKTLTSKTGGKTTQFVCCKDLRPDEPAKVFYLSPELDEGKAKDVVLDQASA